MKLRSSASLNFEAKKEPTRRERFLGEMDKVVPRSELLALIEPSDTTAGRRGRPPMAPSVMLRVHFMQQIYALGDSAAEDALCEIESMRRFAGLELKEESVHDETTILKFRRFVASSSSTAWRRKSLRRSAHT
jgi:IS5 family transposase